MVADVCCPSVTGKEKCMASVVALDLITFPEVWWGVEKTNLLKIWILGTSGELSSYYRGKGRGLNLLLAQNYGC